MIIKPDKDRHHSSLDLTQRNPITPATENEKNSRKYFNTTMTEFAENAMYTLGLFLQWTFLSLAGVDIS